MFPWPSQLLVLSLCLLECQGRELVFLLDWQNCKWTVARCHAPALSWSLFCRLKLSLVLLCLSLSTKDECCISFSWCMLDVVVLAADDLFIYYPCSCSCGSCWWWTWQLRRYLSQTSWLCLCPFLIGHTAPLVIFLVCLGLFPSGVGSVAMVAFTSVFLLVDFWWTRGVLHSICGHVGVVDVIELPSTLACPCVASLGGPCFVTLSSPSDRVAYIYI